MKDEQTIHWYPGHMTKARRAMEADLKLVDAVCELLDARVPYSSRNPDIDALCQNKPRLVILNRADLADPAMTRKWSEYFKSQGLMTLETDSKTRKGINRFGPSVRELLAEKLARYSAKGQIGRTLRVMVVGIPNVGKSTLINAVSGRKGAKAENRPGVTRGKQIRVWNCWTPPASSGPDSRICRWAATWPIPARSRSRLWIRRNWPVV